MVRTQLEQITKEAARLNQTIQQLTETRDQLATDLETVRRGLSDKEMPTKITEDKLNNQIEELELTMVQQYAEGFHSAMDEVACLSPDFYFSQTGILKEVQDGEKQDKAHELESNNIQD